MASTFKTVNATVSSTPATAVYTAPGGTTSIILLAAIANKHAATTRTINMLHTDTSAGTTKSILVNLAITAEDTFLFNDKIVLETGDILKMDVDTGTDVEVVLSILEVA